MWNSSDTARQYEAMGPWMGVDVGGRRKGFDVAVIDDRALVELRGHLAVEEVVALAGRHRPQVIAVDSPRSCAPPDATHRPDEAALRRGVGVGIRWTPPRSALDGNPYYAWILHGLELYAALRGETTVECFPTASWTRWAGPRDGRPRSAWSAAALASLDLAGVAARLNQDQRDAIGAALTARAFARGECERFGEIVVPRRP
jgi:predicted nuclease with RNAse H fold